MFHVCSKDMADMDKPQQMLGGSLEHGLGIGGMSPNDAFGDSSTDDCKKNEIVHAHFQSVGRLICQEFCDQSGKPCLAQKVS